MARWSLDTPECGGGRAHPFLQGDHLVHQLPDAAVLHGDHGNHRDSQGSLEGIGVDGDPLVFRHVQHVQGNDDGGSQEQDLREKVEAPLQAGRVDEQDDHIGPFVNDEVPGDLLLFGAGGEAVRPGKVHDPHLTSRSGGSRPSSPRFPGQFPTCWTARSGD
jgi:hypothetical protein